MIRSRAQYRLADEDLRQFDYESWDQEFESLRARHNFNISGRFPTSDKVPCRMKKSAWHLHGRSTQFDEFSLLKHNRPFCFSARMRCGAALCQCCRFSDLLSTTPYLAALDRRRQRRSSSSVAPTARAPSSPRTGICEQQSAKKKWRQRRRRPHHRAASSRCTTQAARAGRSASRRPISRARVTTANMVNAGCSRPRCARSPARTTPRFSVLTANPPLIGAGLVGCMRNPLRQLYLTV